MWVVAARTAVLSVITGGGKWVEIATHADPLYQHLIVTAERKFWRCVESGEPPRLFGVEPPKPRIEAVRIVDMSASNSWAEFAGLFRSTRQAFLEHERLANIVAEAAYGLFPESEDRGKKRLRADAIDKSVLSLPALPRIRDRDHVRLVAKQPCLICGRRPADAHHLRFAQSRALGRKVSDEFAVPLCRGHHREIHRCGDEAAWWKKVGVDPTVPARTLWLESHPLPQRVVTNKAEGNPERLKRGPNDKTKPIREVGPQ